MNRALSTLITIMFVTVCFSCSQSTNDNEDDYLTADQIEQNSSIEFGIDGEDIPIRIGPGENYEKLVNEKATKALGETQYCKVDYSVRVEILESESGWKKIKVIKPEWLSNSHVGWIPEKYILSKEDEDKQAIGKLDQNDYEILKVKHNSAVENFHVLLKKPSFDKSFVHQFIKQFREENCTMDCNVYVYDSKSILPLVDVYPIKGKEYVKLADHFISMSTFDAPAVRYWYPYQDIQYKKYGGKNWKKVPVE